MDENTSRKKGDRLGKLGTRFAPPPTRAGLLSLTIALAILGTIGVAIGFIFGGTGWRLWVIVPGCVLLGLAALLGVMLKFGKGEPEAFEIRAQGVRYRCGSRKVDIPWEEIERIELHRDSARGRGKRSSELIVQGPKKYIRLSAAFLDALDDPQGLLTMLRECSKQDFKSVLGDPA